MKQRCLPDFLMVMTVMLLGVMAGCTEKDLYDPNYGKEPLPDPSTYFGFEMRGDVTLSVNYGLPGFTTLLEVYDENPMETIDNTPVKKQGVEALFKIYTDDNGKYEGKMNIPTSVTSLYLYTDSWGLPRCVKLNVENGVASYDMTQTKVPDTKTKSATRAYDFEGKVPYLIDKDRNLYSLCEWGGWGSITFDKWGNFINGYVEETSKVGEEAIGTFASRLQNFLLKSTDNSDLVRNADITNIKLTKEGKVSVVFVNKDASYKNTFGYYYYEGNTVDVKSVKKYIVFPNVSLASKEEEEWELRILKCGDKIQLKYFGKDGKDEPTDKFPAGCKIGWFIYSDGYDIDQEEIKKNASLITSNDTNLSYIALNDKSGKVVIGVEDGGNKSYCDMLFYAEATPEDAIDNSGRPDTDPEKPEKPDVIETKPGTLAFEDIWPKGGDYDMNDAIVEYSRQVTFNTKNMVIKIVDKFTPKHDGAMYDNAFAYQIDKNQMGKVTLDHGDMTIENETSSIIVFPSIKQAVKGNVGTYTITRTFDNPSFSKEYLKPYNPFLIVEYAKGAKSRTEVHLPKYKATSLANTALIGSDDDAYYIQRDGAYPFAIDIPQLNFIPVTETKGIDTEYPDFSKWAESKGKKYTDWYNNYKGPKK